MREAQRFADEVTEAYGVTRVKVIVSDTGLDGFSEYWPQHDWITIRAGTLAQGNVRMALVGSLALATLRHSTAPLTTQEERQRRFKTNHRSVDIMVKLLGMSTRQAVGIQVAPLLELNRSGLVGAGYLYGHPLGRLLRVPPCDQVRDLWIHFEQPEPAPTCEKPDMTK